MQHRADWNMVDQAPDSAFRCRRRGRMGAQVALSAVVALGSLFSAANGQPVGDTPDAALTWVRTGGPIGGLGYDIRCSFADHDLWYVTDAWTGAHRSTDRGLTWFSSNEGMALVGPAGDSVPVFSLTVDPHEPNVIWTGSQNSGKIYKSIDAGETWTEKSNGIDQSIAFGLSFRGFTVDPRTADIVYAMGEIASIAWTPDGRPRTGLEMDLTQGVVYKTTDRGEHWTEIWRGDNLARYCWIDPRDPEVLYVSTGIFDRESANTDVEAGFAGGVGIIKSTDGGETWRVLNQENGLGDLYVGSLYMHPEDPDVLLAAAAQNNWSGYGPEHTDGVYLSEDGGEHWQKVLADELFSAVEFCTSDPNVAYAASAQAAYRSEDRGRTWERVTGSGKTWGPPGIIAGFPIDVQCDPDNPMRVFVNNYLGGNLLSEDGGTSWVSASAGYTGALVHSLVVAQGRPGTVFAGTRTGVFRSDDGGGTWVGLTYPGPEIADTRMNEIRSLAVDPADADHLLAGPADLGTVVSTRNGGLRWDAVVEQPPGDVPAGLIFAPSNPQRVYATLASEQCKIGDPTSSHECQVPGSGLMVSDDGGASWSPAEDEQVAGTAVIALAVPPNDADTVYLSTPAMGVFKSTDGGQTLTPSNGGLPTRPVIALAVAPSDPDMVFAGIAGGAVYRSTDAGESWTQTSAGLDPNAHLRSMAVDPADSRIAYAADFHTGVYRSTDSGETWTAINNGLDHRAVYVLALSDDGKFLYAGIEGGGVYRLDLAGEPPPATDWPGEDAADTPEGDEDAGPDGDADNDEGGDDGAEGEGDSGDGDDGVADAPEDDGVDQPGGDEPIDSVPATGGGGARRSSLCGLGVVLLLPCIPLMVASKARRWYKQC